MQISDIYIGGVVLILVLLGGVMALFAYLDAKTMHRIGRVATLLAGCMAVVLAYTWSLLRLNSWIVAALLAFVMIVATAWLAMLKSRISQHSMFLPMLAGVAVGTVTSGAIIIIGIYKIASPLVLIAVMMLLCGHLLNTLPKSLQTYVSSLMHTQNHYSYMLANGATPKEALRPSLLRALRASVMPSLKGQSTLLVIAPPIVFGGMLLGGASPLAAVVMTGILFVAMLAESVLATWVMLAMSNSSLFDQHGMMKGREVK